MGYLTVITAVHFLATVWAASSLTRLHSTQYLSHGRATFGVYWLAGGGAHINVLCLKGSQYWDRDNLFRVSYALAREWHNSISYIIIDKYISSLILWPAHVDQVMPFYSLELVLLRFATNFSRDDSGEYLGLADGWLFMMAGDVMEPRDTLSIFTFLMRVHHLTPSL